MPLVLTRRQQAGYWLHRQVSRMFRAPVTPDLYLFVRSGAEKRVQESQVRNGPIGVACLNAMLED